MHRDAAYAHQPRALPREPARRGAASAGTAPSQLGEQHGYRNAQATVLAPTGTIGLLMDCDTTGVEPDFALVKFKKLAGGGYFKIVNQSVPERAEEARLHRGARCRRSSSTSAAPPPSRARPHVTARRSRPAGLTGDDLAKVEERSPACSSSSSAFAARDLGDEACERLGLMPQAGEQATFSLLTPSASPRAD